MNIMLLALKLSLNAIASTRTEATEEPLGINLDSLARNMIALCKINALNNEHTAIDDGLSAYEACWKFMIYYEIYNNR